MPKNLRLAAVALTALVACTDIGPQFTRVNLYLTDAPSDQIASAEVWISSAYLMPGKFTITSTPQQFDLLTLQNGVTALLGSADIPAGDYAELRLVVDSARVTLVDGVTFEDGSTSASLKVPSGEQSGIKVHFSGRLHLDPAEVDIVVDVPVADNFVLQGTDASPRRVSFTPSLRGTVQ